MKKISDVLVAEERKTQRRKLAFTPLFDDTLSVSQRIILRKECFGVVNVKRVKMPDISLWHLINGNYMNSVDDSDLYFTLNNG